MRIEVRDEKGEVVFAYEAGAKKFTVEGRAPALGKETEDVEASLREALEFLALDSRRVQK